MSAKSLTEAAFQSQVTDLCDWLHLTWHHETDSRKSKAGFPDLVIVGNAVLFVELKSAKGSVTAEQARWLAVLEAAGAEVHVWRPTDWEYLFKRLQELAR